MSDIYVLKELYMYFERRCLLWINQFMMATRISETKDYVYVSRNLSDRYSPC
jgi:hypothetical protein